MSRYIAKPVRFWLVHTLVLPVLTVAILLVPIYFFTILWPGALDASLSSGRVLAFFLGMILAAYLIGAGLAATYSALLALWQWRRGGHTVIEAMLLGWLLVGVVFGAVTLSGSSYDYNLLFAIACAAAMPLMWLVCLWSGITYRHVIHLQQASA